MLAVLLTFVIHQVGFLLVGAGCLWLVRDQRSNAEQGQQMKQVNAAANAKEKPPTGTC